MQGAGVGAESLGGPVGAGAGWGVDGYGSTPGKKEIVVRLVKWLKVYPEFGHDWPEK